MASKASVPSIAMVGHMNGNPSNTPMSSKRTRKALIAARKKPIPVRIGPAAGIRPISPNNPLQNKKTATKISGTSGDQKKEPNFRAAKAVALPTGRRSSLAKSTAARRAMAPPM